MMRLFINSLAASAGGGLTYIRNVLPHLAAKREVEITVALSSDLRAEFLDLPQVKFLELEISPGRRFWYEQSKLPGLIRRCHADVLLSTGNFALRRSPVPQILFSRNSIYTSPDFYRDLCLRREYGPWLDTHVRAVLAKRSVHWANVTVAPSEAFATELRSWTGMRILAIPHGFDHEAFNADSSPLASEVEMKLRAAEESFKLLFVSHYNYYRNFETLIRALPLLRESMAGRSVKLLLTCSLVAGKSPGKYHPESAAELVQQLGVSDMVVELGTIPYSQLHQIYARADSYVTAAYTETFAHPLVEAMASGLPIVASDLAVHREICGEAAVYFPRFSSEELGERVAQVALSPQISRHMAAFGLERAHRFSWKMHADRIIELSASLMDPKGLSKECETPAKH